MDIHDPPPARPIAALASLTAFNDRRSDRSYSYTPDGRYFVVNGRLWRLSNPNLAATVREYWVHELMQARRQVREAKADYSRRATARTRVDLAKHALGERGPPWWEDGAPDYNRRNVANTPYAAWFKSLMDEGAIAETRKLACDDRLIEAKIVASLADRDAAASTCPSEIARLLPPDNGKNWQSLMPQVREVVAKLARSGVVRITRGSTVLNPNNLADGPIRIRRGPKFSV